MPTQSTVPRTILIAEDSPTDQLLLTNAYARTGLPHTLRFVNHGRAAMDYLEGKAPYDNRTEFPIPHLLVLDLKMDQADGFHVLRFMQMGGFKRIPVVVLSDSDLKVDRNYAKQLGAREYHVKPPRLDDTVQFFNDLCARYLKPEP